MQSSFLSRRTAMKAGGAAGLTAVLAAAAAVNPAAAQSLLGSSPAQGEPIITDLGPAVAVRQHNDHYAWSSPTFINN